MERKHKALIIGAIIISLVGSIALVCLFSGSRLSYVVDSYAAKNAVYVIDDSDKDLSIMKLNDKGKILGEISQKKLKKGIITTFDYLTKDGNNVYVYKIEKEVTSNTVLSEGVYLCDFDREKLKLAWDLPVINSQNQNTFAVSVKKGNLFYFNVNYDQTTFKAQAVVNKMKPGSNKEKPLALVNYDIGISFTDFFYADTGDIVFTTPEGKLFKADLKGGDNNVDLEPLLPPQGEEATNPAEAESTEAAPNPAEAENLAAMPNPAEAENPAAMPNPAEAENPAAMPNPAEAENPAAMPNTADEENPAAMASAEQEAPLVAVDVQTVAKEQLKEPQKADKLKGVKQYEAVQFYPSKGATDRAISNFTTDGRHTVYFVDVSENKFVGYDLAENSLVNDIPEAKLLEPIDETNRMGYNAAELRSARFTNENTYSAGAVVGENKVLLGVFHEDGGQIFEKLNSKVSDMFMAGILYFLGFLILFVLGYLLRGVFLNLTSGKIPVVTKVIFACIPVVIISVLALQYLINSMFVNQTVENQYKELYLISKQQTEAISAQLISDIDRNDPFKNMYYYELRQILNALPAQSTIYSQDQSDSKDQSVYDFGYHWLYVMDRGVLKSLYTDQNFINVPIDYYYDKKTSELFYNATLQKKTMKGSFKDVGGEWIVLAIPILDDNGRVVAVMETGTTKASLEYAVNRNTNKINLVNAGILLILILTLSLLIYLCLKPLKRLKVSVNEITNGNMGVQTKVKGRDEIAEIGDVFNQMSTSIEYHVNELTALNDGYYKFVPAKIFELLKKSSVTDVKLGDHTNMDVCVLTVNATNFDSIVSTMDGDQMFKLINKVLSDMVPAVTRNGGVIDKFEKTGFTAFFTGEPERAMKAAISILEKVEQENKIGAYKLDNPFEIASAISFGSVMIGIVGHESRQEATNISENVNLAGFLRRIAPKYSAKILTIASAIENVEKFDDKFNDRFIGYVAVTATGKVEKLYDIFDGDDEDGKILKKQTKELFESGVDLYCRRDFYEARLVFIEVLKQNRDDGAAKEYLYRCDNYYQLADMSKIDICIEKY